jgi:hypothetical protein
MGKPTGPAPVAPCKLCETVAELRWSHIMPRWVYRRIVASQPAGKPNPVRLQFDAMTFHAAQAADYLLCEACEEKLGTWEKYASEVTREGDTFPALTEAEAHPIPRSAFGDLVHVTDVSALSVETLVRFGISVLWRAAVSASYKPPVCLGPYAGVLRNYLLGASAALPDRVRLVMYLIHSKTVPELAQLNFLPSSTRVDGNFMHHFVAYGMGFQLFIGSQLHALLDPICLDRKKVALVTSGALHLRSVVAKVARSTPKGAFARHLGRDPRTPLPYRNST